MIPVTFPTYARVALSLVMAVAGFLLAGEIVADETTRGYIAVTLAFISSAGIVPAKPSDFTFPPSVRWLLTGVSSVGSYFVTTADGIDPTVHGLILGGVFLISCLVIVPPQAKV